MASVSAEAPDAVHGAENVTAAFTEELKKGNSLFSLTSRKPGVWICEKVVVILRQGESYMKKSSRKISGNH